ncbi:MAG TPA: nicotinate-nucleotide adenylyltransferase [Spongiibacteraceae bacterium]|jgi:nicotinate-nucleotide adenylyltransferase|nr:nicotinate-nucleotide adenylyltransferase [Spongiibacteraceae bacterium]HUH37824.1 nicotinate-nucleotide adenylyltransferase [Spongiibacteraceae bacterium]
MRRRARIGIFGGTFDPVHYGHLRSAQALRDRLGLDEVRLMPARVPPHRPQPGATAEQRVRMLQLALADLPGLAIDTRELSRPGPSYSVDSLEALRAELGDAALCLVLGADAFAGLHTWHEWQRIPGLAHILVLARPGYEWPREPALEALCEQRLVADPEQLFERPCGGLAALSLPPVPVSATAIRARIARGEAPHFLLPEAVWHYIQAHGLYRNEQESA